MGGKIYESISELVGATPLLHLLGYERKHGALAKIDAKLEYFNPAGSAKDRVARQILDAAEADGTLKSGSVIIEPTSGNTGIGLAALGAARGYRVIIVMPDTMSRERQLLMKAYGAELVLTDGALGMNGAISRADELARNIDGAFIAGQFTNPENPNAHFLTTGPEIWQDTDGTIDIFVAGVGTGGTLTGIGKFLRSENPNIEIVAVEPDTSAVLSGEPAGAHMLQGIGAGFIPEILDTSLIDKIIKVSRDEAYSAAREVALTDGILVGISSGAALEAARRLSLMEENRGKRIVTLLPDGGERYLSSGLYE